MVWVFQSVCSSISFFHVYALSYILWGTELLYLVCWFILKGVAYCEPQTRSLWHPPPRKFMTTYWSRVRIISWAPWDLKPSNVKMMHLGRGMSWFKSRSLWFHFALLWIYILKMCLIQILHPERLSSTKPGLLMVLGECKHRYALWICRSTRTYNVP